jgi:hypothetical protein
MIQVFDVNHGFGGKVNFVDDENVVVGYDTDTQCCEDAGWCVLRSLPQHSASLAPGMPDKFDFANYRFDPNTQPVELSLPSETEAVAFRLVSQHNQEAWLILHNTHNGYYAHGWARKGPGIAYEDGYI